MASQVLQELPQRSREKRTGACHEQPDRDTRGVRRLREDRPCAEKCVEFRLGVTDSPGVYKRMRRRSWIVACSTTSSSATAPAYRSQNVDLFDMWSGPFERQTTPRGKPQENSTYLQIFLSQLMRSVPSSSNQPPGDSAMASGSTRASARRFRSMSDLV